MSSIWMFSLKKFIFYLSSLLSKYIITIFINKITFLLVEVYYKNIYSITFFLKSHINFKFDLLIDITCIDLLYRGMNYIIYNYISVLYSARLFIGSLFSFSENINSISAFFSSAEWFEREIFDMFGIKFNNHLDLRRILCDYGFDGFPLRKDFPISGYLEPYYDISTRLIEYKPVHLSQECRVYEFISPWSQL